MRVLITYQYYWPEKFLINDIAEDLVKRGHDVTVLTGLPDYSTTKVPKEYKWFRRRKEEHNGVKIIRVPIIARHHGFIMRVINYLSFLINSSIYAMIHRIDTDVILAYQTAPVFMINPARIWRKKLKKNLFIYVLDIWPDQMKVWNVKENNWLFKLVLKYCKKTYGSGDVVGITSKPFEDYLVNVCDVERDKIVYIPQHSEKLILKTVKKEKKQIDLIFAGNIGEQQNLECLLKAISLIKTKKKYHVHIYGNGTSFESVRKYANELVINDKVTFYGRVSKKELNDIYSKMDAFLLTLCDESKIGFVANTVPAKLQSYMSAGKPIIASIDGGAFDIINESKCGIAVKANDASAFASAIKKFIENPNIYSDCGKNAIQYFNDNFEKKKVMDKIEKLLIDLSITKEE